MDILATLNHSISLVSRLREISKNLSEAEFKNLLADLSSELADAKIHIAELKTQLAALAEENRSLKAAAPESKQTPTQKWGCYQFVTTGVRFELSAPTRFLDQKNGA